MSIKKQDYQHQKTEDILAELEKELNLLPPSLRDWGEDYFRDSRERYISQLSLIKRHYAGGEILEVGAVPCHMTFCLRRKGFPVTSLDLEPDRAAAFIQKHKLPILKCDIERERIPFPDEHFMMILCTEVFEHLRIDPIITLREINRVLHRQGKLIFSTPNLYTLDRMIKYLRGGGMDDPLYEYKKLSKVGHMGHFRIYTTRQIKQFLTYCGFTIQEIQYEMYHKMRKQPRFYFRDVCMRLIPKLRRFQIFIAGKYSA